MKNSYTNKVGLEPAGASGINQAPALTFNEIMNLLIKVLIRLGLLKRDLDYHLIRASMVVIYFFFGYQKWFAYEAQGLIPFISNSPLMSWMYPVFGIREPVGFWGFRNGCLAGSCS
jgi:hypothetical protein